MHKYGGIVLDYYDDKGATLKAKFPTVDDLPDQIKTATVCPKDEVPDGQFALVALDGGDVLKKFACTDAGTTAMSVIYFMEHGDKLPEEAQKTAAANLCSACLSHSIIPPISLTKLANMAAFTPAMGAAVGAATGAISSLIGSAAQPNDPMDPALAKVLKGAISGAVTGATTVGVAQGTSSHLGGMAAGSLAGVGTRMALDKAQKDMLMDITGRRPMPKMANLRPKDPGDYMLGSKFPIDTWDRVKQAERYIQDNTHLLEPSIRRHCCVKLSAKAETIGYPLDGTIKEAGAQTFAQPGHIKVAIEMRKLAIGSDPEQSEYLDELFEKRAQIGEGYFSECLRRFDIEGGLDDRWSRDLPDPWESTFGLKKTADIIWEQGGDTVSAQALLNLARNRPNLMTDTFASPFKDEFMKDPVGIFKSLPLPQKKLLARMAEDAASDGSSSQHQL